ETLVALDLSEYDLYDLFFLGHGLLGRFRGAHLKCKCKLWPVSLTLIGVYIATVLCLQHFTEQEQTELAINLLTEKIPKGKRSKVWLYFAPKYSNIATCS